jgi:hypothetical protein
LCKIQKHCFLLYGCAKKLKNGESLKDPMTRKFVQEIEKKQKYKEKIYQEVEKVAGKVRGFYDKSLIEEIGEEDFTKMMFIDGCFVVQFIHCVTSKYDDLHMSDQEVADRCETGPIITGESAPSSSPGFVDELEVHRRRKEEQD